MSPEAPIPMVPMGVSFAEHRELLVHSTFPLPARRDTVAATRVGLHGSPNLFTAVTSGSSHGCPGSAITLPGGCLSEGAPGAHL